MTSWVALLRAVNVGGTGKLPMADLRALAESCGFEAISTYIASGNLLFRSDLTEGEIKRLLEQRLAVHAGKSVGVLVRTAAELAAVRDANPFREAPSNRVAAIFLDGAPPSHAIERATGRGSEVIALGTREIYVHYPQGQADTKLRIPDAAAGTARNMNTVANLAELAARIL